MTVLTDLNQPDEGLLGGALAMRGKALKGLKGPRGKEPLKVQLERRKGILNIDRMTWWANWYDLGQHFRPYRGRFLDMSQSDTNKGWRRNWQIVDSTPLIANNTCAAGLLAGMASPSRPWFAYKLDDEQLMEAEGVKEWLDQVTKVNRSILGSSNFYNSLFECLGEFGVFGTMALGKEWGFPADPREPDVPHFQAFTIGSYWVGNDKHRRVNVFFRDFRWTIQQVIDKFTTGPLDEEKSWENISARTRALWNAQQYDVMIDITHAVDENLARVKSISGDYKADASGMRFRSVYYERGGEPDKILKNSASKGPKEQEDNAKTLRVKGFRDFPVLVARWYTNSEDAWGRGPAMDALGDARALQLQQKRKAQAIDRLVDPPMKAHPSLRNQRTSLLPGDVTFVAPEQGQVGFEPVYEIKPDIQGMLADIKETQDRIKFIMYSDIFAMFISAEQTGQPITAAQVNAEQQEKLLMLGPVLEQSNYDLFNPLHEWLFAEGLRHGKYPPIPQALRRATIRVEYTSILAQAINAITAGAIEKFFGFVGEVAQLSQAGADNPALDKVDFDDGIEEYGKATGVPPTVIRSDAEVQQIRARRAQRQQAQAQQEQQTQAAQAAQAHAGAVQKLSQSPMGTGSALDVLAQAAGAGQVANA